MEKVGDETAAFTSIRRSPRSVLGWKDDWGYEIAGLEPTKSKSFVGISPMRSKSCEELTSVNPDGSKAPPLQLQLRLFRSLSPPLNPDRRVYGSLSIPESPSGNEGTSPPVPKQLWTNSPPTPTIGAFRRSRDERGRRGQPSELWETTWRQGCETDESPLPPFSRAGSAGCLSTRDDDNSVGTAGEDSWSVDSSGSNAATTALGKKTPPSTPMQYLSSLSDELKSIESCVKRAIDFGERVQHYGALEVSQLREEKANAEASVQTLQRERELEVLVLTNEIQELEMERNTLMKAARDEKNKREQLQSEVDYVLSVVLEEKMKLDSEREAYDTALLNERKKLQAMKKARDAAVQALQDGTQKLEIERDAMLMAMRDLTSRLDFERDAKLRSMRRTSIETATMMSTFRLSGSRKRGINIDDEAPLSRSLSRQNSRQSKS